MKNKFSKHWVSSKRKSKQRKYRFNAPLHLKRKFLNAHLSKALREKYGKRSFPLRKGDEVLVMRGSFKKKKAKISEVDLKRLRVSLEKIQRSKKDGTKVNVWFSPRVLKIESLNLEDRRRISSVELKNKTNKAESKKENQKNASN